MTLDNDLLTLWLGAWEISETGVRDLIEQIQLQRDYIADDNAQADEETAAENETLKSERDAAETERDEMRAERDDALRDLELMRDEARAAMARLQDALGETRVQVGDNTVVALPLRGRKKP